MRTTLRIVNFLLFIIMSDRCWRCEVAPTSFIAFAFKVHSKRALNEEKYPVLHRFPVLRISFHPPSLTTIKSSSSTPAPVTAIKFPGLMALLLLNSLNRPTNLPLLLPSSSSSSP
jgi:hypothetical protein